MPPLPPALAPCVGHCRAVSLREARSRRNRRRASSGGLYVRRVGDLIAAAFGWSGPCGDAYWIPRCRDVGHHDRDVTSDRKALGTLRSAAWAHVIGGGLGCLPHPGAYARIRDRPAIAAVPVDRWGDLPRLLHRALPGDPNSGFPRTGRTGGADQLPVAVVDAGLLDSASWVTAHVEAAAAQIAIGLAGVSRHHFRSGGIDVGACRAAAQPRVAVRARAGSRRGLGVSRR